MTGAEGAVTILPPTLLHPEYLLAALPVLALFAWYTLRGGATRRRLAYLLVRCVVIALIAIAAAAPVYYESHKQVDEVPPVIILVDGSASMRAYPHAKDAGYLILGRIKDRVGNLTGKTENLKLETFSEGNRTAIGDAVYHALVQYGGEPVSIVLVSDGRSNAGRSPQDLAAVMAESNSTLYALKPEKAADDVYLQAALGEKKIPLNTPYDLLLRVGYTGRGEVSYGVNVYVDGARRFEKRFKQEGEALDIPLSLSIRDVGIHEIRVELDWGGGFPENDAIYKTVEVVAKPRILYVSGNKTSPMLEVLSKLYNVDVTPRVDNDYSNYAAVILDNVNARELDRNRVNKLKKYLLDGNGVGFIGGRNSFEYGGYNSSFVENILPVKSMDKPVERRRDFAVVFLVDISESTEYGVGANSKIDVEKALVLGMLTALNSNDTVGVIAFNTVPYVVSPASPLGPKYTELQDRILRLQFGGGTEMQGAIESADAMLSGRTTDKYLIIVSDGLIRSSRSQLALNKIAQMRDDGIKTFAVGVGFDTDENFMQELAREGGGQYFSIKSNPENRLKIVFGDEADDKTKDKTPVVRRDEYHYITRNLVELEASAPSVTGYNKVQEKNVAQLLLSSRGGKPVLTVWRFGLGRVAAFTADNGIEWSRDLLKTDSGKLVSALTNWLIGDLEKGKKVRVNARDASLGDPVAVSVTALGNPSVEAKDYATAGSYGVVVSRTGINSYSGYFTPAEGGIYGVKAVADGVSDEDAVAVNYPKEYSQFGVDDDLLRRMSAATGTRLYSQDEAETLADELFERVKKSSTEEIRDRKDLWVYFAAGALAVYFADTVVRRLIVLLKKDPERSLVDAHDKAGLRGVN